MSPTEALALSRLRQWFSTRSAEQQTKCRRPNALGWQRRDQRSYDAGRVRVMDTEKALEQLTAEEQTILIYRYVYREPDHLTAQAIGWSTRKLSYRMIQARGHLASVMDRMSLL